MVAVLKEDWEFSVLNVYNYRKLGPLRFYFDFIRQNHARLEGNLLEAGVFQGHSILATGLLLKELKSNKRVYGFDSFQGFPAIYDDNDQLDMFNRMVTRGQIDQEHYSKVKRNSELRALILEQPVSVQNVSSSGNFSRASKSLLEKKIDLLGLDNVVLVEGSFEETMVVETEEPARVMAALVDCDLYRSYKAALPFIWGRLVTKGYMFLDEYYSLKFPGARVATDEFFKNKADKPQRHATDLGEFERWYVRKTKA